MELNINVPSLRKARIICRSLLQGSTVGLGIFIQTLNSGDADVSKSKKESDAHSICTRSPFVMGKGNGSAPKWRRLFKLSSGLGTSAGGGWCWSPSSSVLKEAVI